MLKQNVQYCVNDSQYIDVSNNGAKRMSLTLFVRNLIRENATHHLDRYTLFFCDLSFLDKKEFLFNLLDLRDYDYFSSTEARLKLAFREYEDECQSLINSEIDDVYHEDMREMNESLNRSYLPLNELYLERR